MSIHPRMEYTGDKRRKLNTCKPCKNTSKGKLGRKAKRLNARRNDHSITLKNLPSSQANAYRVPGSMKGF